MTWFEAVVQGIIQGLTEFLPISSSGHLSLYQYFTGNSGEAGALFSLVLHLGTLIAVVAAFWGTLWPLIAEGFGMIGALFTGRLDRKHPNERQKMIYLLAVSLLPLFGTLVLKDLLQGVAADNDIVVEGVCFLITGALLLMTDSCVKGHRRAGQMTYRSALFIGCVQAIAPLPGLSRSGTTLSAGMLLGLDPVFAVNFSFIMGIPAVIAALLIDVKEIVGGTLGLSAPIIILGITVSALFGLLSIWMVRWLVKEQKLRWFGYYTLILGVLVLAIGIFEMVTDHAVQSAVVAWFQTP